MKKLLSVLGTGFLCFGITACNSTPSPVAPSETTEAPSSLGAGRPAAAGASAGKPAAAAAARPGNLTIVQIVLQDDGEFDVLQAAVIRAGLADVLNGPGQFTVFAPTDAAFVQTLGVADEAAAIDAVNGLPVNVLKDILLYHVTDGRRISTSVLAAPRYTS